MVIIIIAFTTLLFVVAIKSIQKNNRILAELNEMKARLSKSYHERNLLMEDVLRLTESGGIGESSVLSLMNEMARIENNLFHMRNYPGYKQITKALERMKAILQAEDYTYVPLLRKTYNEGMNVQAVFVHEENVPSGEAMIVSVQKPQVNHAGKMIQAAKVTVGQNN